MNRTSIVEKVSTFNPPEPEPHCIICGWTEGELNANNHCADCASDPKFLTSMFRPASELLAENEAFHVAQLQLAYGDRMGITVGGERALGEMPMGEPMGVEAGKTPQGLASALSNSGVEYRYNLRGNRLEYRHEKRWSYGGYIGTGFLYDENEDWTDWQPFSDISDAKLRDQIGRHFCYQDSRDRTMPLKFGKDTWKHCLNVLAYDTQTDPFLVWLEALPPWDGVERLASWLPTMFAITDNLPLAQWASTYMVLGAVARTYTPGLKLDEMPVLMGDPGIGKSTCIRQLLPDEHEEWFSDSLHLAADPKQRAESLQGRVLVEAAEMAGSTRADQESLKAFLSRTDDGGVRLAYRMNPEAMPRRCIIIGTSDKAEPLPNDRNTRRFVAVRCGKGNPTLIRRYLEAHRAQLWAEALDMHHNGIEARLPSTLKQMQEKANSTARSRDTVIEDAVERYLAENGDGFTLAELVSAIGLIPNSEVGSRLPMRDQHRVGAVLDGLGLRRKRERSNGGLSWIWRYK